MSKKSKDAAQTVKNTTGGGHVGGTTSGHQPDAKTSKTVDKKGDKARPNDGRD